jgi:hypothetical protein
MRVLKFVKCIQFIFKGGVYLLFNDAIGGMNGGKSKCFVRIPDTPESHNFLEAELSALLDRWMNWAGDELSISANYPRQHIELVAEFNLLDGPQLRCKGFDCHLAE